MISHLPAPRERIQIPGEHTGRLALPLTLTHRHFFPLTSAQEEAAHLPRADKQKPAAVAQLS